MRYLLSFGFLLVLFGGLTVVKVRQVSALTKMGQDMERAGPRPEAVGTALAEESAWEGIISTVGSVVAARGVGVSTDVPGIVARIVFKSDTQVREGQALAALDTSVERAQLASARVRRDLADTTVRRSRTLLSSGAITQSQLDSDEAALMTAATDFVALKAQIDKKTVRAPFAGRIGLRLVNVGQFLSPGTPIATLEAIDAAYVEFTLPQQRVAEVKIGMPVRFTLGPAGTAPVEGTISALEPGIDPVTRAVKVRAAMPKDERMRAGMFGNVAVVLPQRASVVTIPATAVVHAPYGDSVFVAEDRETDAGALIRGEDGKPIKIARQQFVRLGESRGDFAAVVGGVRKGQEVVSSGAFKLRNGATIAIDNSVMPDASAAPRLENR